MKFRSAFMETIAAPRVVLADRLWAGQGVLRSVALVVAGALLVALCARISIPLYPVPVTGQTFGVLLVGGLLGCRRGAFSMGVYLALGAMGLPVFAGGTSGLSILLKPTAGYLFGFVVAAGLVGWLCQRGWDRRYLSTAAAMSLGTLVIFALGSLWLSQFVGWHRVLGLGVVPFLPGAAIKIALAALLLPGCCAIEGSGREVKADSDP
jgi:biotin transport system substrate-specific component